MRRGDEQRRVDWGQVNVRLKVRQLEMIDRLIETMNLSPRHAHEHVTRASLVRKWIREGLIKEMAQENVQP